MTQAIESVPGVRRADVDFQRARADVQADDCRQSKLEAITEAVVAAGFGATITEVTARPAVER